MTEGSGEAPAGGHARFDVIGGVALVAVGLAAALIAQDYPFGTLRRMGPGFLPTVLSVLLIVCGIVIAVKRPDAAEAAPPLGARPLLAILGSILAFALLIRPAGLVVATLAAVPVAALAEGKLRPVAILLLAAGMAVMVCFIFVWFLAVPMSLGWW